VVRPEVIRRRLEDLTDYLRILERIGQYSEKEFLADPEHYGNAAAPCRECKGISMTCAAEYSGAMPARGALPLRWIFALGCPLGLGETLPVGRL
jgi:hypothetical protein